MKIGMIGGIGPESTVDYYQRLIRLYQENISAENYPEIVIYSINMTAMLELEAEGNWDGLTAMLAGAAAALHRAGADFAFMASNTPHIVFDRVRQASPIPLVSIVTAACGEAERLGLRKAGLLGTLFTMRSDYYQAEFAGAASISSSQTPRSSGISTTSCLPEIEHGIFLEETRQGLLRSSGG
jgi:aspartate racemase